MLDSFQLKRVGVVDAVSELASLADSVGARSVAARVRDSIVQKLRDDRFNLVVVGEFNHGKTTLVNALLGASVLPVGVTPTTAVIHEISWGDTPCARTEYESGEVKEVPFDQVRFFALGNPAPEPDPGPVRALLVRYPAPLLRDHVNLVDTPGVNDLSLQRADITYKYIPQSDAVLFLLDAGQMLTASERVFLQEKLLGQSRDKIVFVVTKKDILSPSELDDVMAYARDNLAKLVPSPRLFAVSAEQAIDNHPDSGLTDLMDHLELYLSEERGRILLDNALGEAVAACRILDKGIGARRRALQMSVEELSRRIENVERELAGQQKTIEQRRSAIREEVAAIKAWSRRDLEHLVTDVAEQIPGIVERSSVDELKSHLGPFLERSFRDWAQAETREIADALESLAEKTIALVRDDARDSGRKLADALGADLKAPPIAVDSFAYDIGVAAPAIIGIGVLFSNVLLGAALIAASPLLAWFVRGRIDAETRTRARELAPAAIRQAAETVAPKLDEMIDQFAQKLDAWVVAAGQEVFREILEVLESTREEREKGQHALDEASVACDRQADALASLLQRYERMRSDLWMPPAESPSA